MNYYGIDLGTSNCLVARVTRDINDNYEVKCLKDDENNESFPSIVYYENDVDYKVGNAAKRYLTCNPERTFDLVKLRLGQTKQIEPLTGDNNFIKSPIELTSNILNHFNVLHKDIQAAVVTVPAVFDQSQKDATMQSCEIADIEPTSLLEEPTAAIIYHIFAEYENKKSDFFDYVEVKNVLVFDFGGGTLDLSLINITKDTEGVIPKVLAVEGDNSLGGSKIDFAFTKYILDRMYDKSNGDDIKVLKDIFDDYYSNYIENGTLQFNKEVEEDQKNYIHSLKRKVEKAKIELTLSEKIQFKPPGGLEGALDEIPVTRTQFEKEVLNNDELAISDKIKKIIDRLLDQMEEQNEDWVIDEVLLVGGSSQIPYIKEIMCKRLRQFNIREDDIKFSHDFEKAVVKGAAIQAALLAGEEIMPFKSTCQSVVARDIIINHGTEDKVFIKKGTEYPFIQKKNDFVKISHSLSDAVNLTLCEKINDDSKEKKKIITEMKFLIPIYYTGDEIEIFMDIDKAGLYQIEAVHKNTNESVEFIIKKDNLLTDEQLKEIKNKTKNDISLN